MSFFELLELVSVLEQCLLFNPDEKLNIEEKKEKFYFHIKSEPLDDKLLLKTLDEEEKFDIKTDGIASNEQVRKSFTIFFRIQYKYCTETPVQKG